MNSLVLIYKVRFLLRASFPSIDSALNCYWSKPVVHYVSSLWQFQNHQNVFSVCEEIRSRDWRNVLFYFIPCSASASSPYVKANLTLKWFYLSIFLADLFKSFYLSRVCGERLKGGKGEGEVEWFEWYGSNFSLLPIERRLWSRKPNRLATKQLKSFHWQGIVILFICCGALHVK